MSFTAFFGYRNSLVYNDDMRPRSYREKILELWPNGDVTLTALTNLCKSEPVTDPEFRWFNRSYNSRSFETSIYKDASLTTAYGAGNDLPADSVVYAKLAENDAKQLRPAHQVLLRTTNVPENDVVGKVISVVPQGSNSFAAVKLLEADGGADRPGDLSDCDRLTVAGSIHPELDTLPAILSRDPVRVSNYTQIFMNAIGASRTAKKTKLRTGNDYAQKKADGLLDHARDIEQAIIHGIPTEKIGDNGEPERTTGGILWMLRNYAPANILNYTTDPGYAGKSWLQGGEEWFDRMVAKVFEFGDENRVCLCGNGALTAIQDMVKDRGEFKFEPTTTAYGIKVVRWVTPFGDLMLKRYPSFNFDPTERHSILIVSPRNMRYRYIDDTDFLADLNEKKGGHYHIDGTKEGWLTECGFEIHHPETFAYVIGIGKNNTVS